jgi:hypothetical protein
MHIPQCSDGIDNDGDGNVDAGDAGCHVDGDLSKPYDPNGTDEGSEPVGPGGSFTMSHRPYPINPPHVTNHLADEENPAHQLSDLQMGAAAAESTETVINIVSVGGFTGPVTVSAMGISLDDLPTGQPDGPDLDTLPDSGDGRPDDPTYSIPVSQKVITYFDGTSSVSRVVNAGSSLRFKVKKRNLQAGRYIIQLKGTANIGGASVSRFSEVVLVVGEGTSGYREE